jgi:hypothetical protein
MGRKLNDSRVGCVFATFPKANVLAMALLAGCIAVTATERAKGQPVVNGLMTTTIDEPLKYRANGRVNTSSEWGKKPPAVEGPWYNVPGIVPPPADGGGPHWEFSVRHSAAEFGTVQVNGQTVHQAVDAQLSLKGRHIRVPPPGHGEGPNNLPEISTTPVTIEAGKSANVATWGGLQHLGQEPPHYDSYAIVGNKMSYSVIGATGTLGGKVEIGSLHDEKAHNLIKTSRTGSSLTSSAGDGSNGGSTISFDAQTGILSFSPGRIDVLDLFGGLSGNIDPKYMADPILESQFSVSDLRLQGRQSDGRFMFSGGNLSISDDSRQLGLTASFDEYVIGDSSQPLALGSSAVLRRGESFELLDGDRPTFLGDFAADHFLQGLPTSNQFPERTLEFGFITGPGMDLATLTQGFTRSAQFVPADIFVGGSGYVPAPDSADFNGDGQIDSRDYVVWRSEFGSLDGQADGNHDGIVDAADYVLWRANLAPGTTNVHVGPLASRAEAIPEPSIAALMVIALCLALPAYRGPRIRWAAVRVREGLGSHSSDGIICPLRRRDAELFLSRRTSGTGKESGQQ